MTFKKYIGKEIEEILSPLSYLRITVFKDFPYLYEGSHLYEMDYLKIYVNSPKAMVFGVFDGDKMVGACTCIPLSDETFEVQKPFLEKEIDIDSIFYFGESLLLKDYRGQGIGHRFFDERENHAKSYGSFLEAYFCSVIRPDDHLIRPIDYRSNNEFWKKRGYTKIDRLKCVMSWQDIDENVETDKELIFWKKELK